jgi:carboxymethylenebutenolidase
VGGETHRLNPDRSDDMCDQDHFERDLARYAERAALTRRQLGVLSAGVGLSLLLPRAANALDVSERDALIATPDGTADCHFVHPASGAHAGVLIWPDILGLRPAFRQIGRRLAEAGYAVLVVNPFYRSKRAPIAPAGASFADQATRDLVMPLARSLNATTHATDARAFVAWLDAQPAVDKARKLGTTGYCMGGPITLRTAAALPERIGAAASFHGGGLVTDKPDSPHLLVPQIKAQYLFAVAENDDAREPEAKNVLREAFAKAGLTAEIEVYPAAHGWCPPDSPVYDEAQAERAWGRMLALFGRALG